MTSPTSHIREMYANHHRSQAIQSERVDWVDLFNVIIWSRTDSIDLVSRKSSNDITKHKTTKKLIRSSREWMQFLFRLRFIPHFRYIIIFHFLFLFSPSNCSFLLVCITIKSLIDVLYLMWRTQRTLIFIHNILSMFKTCTRRREEYMLIYYYSNFRSFYWNFFLFFRFFHSHSFSNSVYSYLPFSFSPFNS